MSVHVTVLQTNKQHQKCLPLNKNVVSGLGETFGLVVDYWHGAATSSLDQWNVTCI